MRGVRRASTTQATAPHTGYCDGLRCSGSLLATPSGLPSADLAKTRPHLTCFRSCHHVVNALRRQDMTCRDAKRGERASTSCVKTAGGMPGPRRMPSAMPCEPWSERLQLGGGHAEHRRPSAALLQTLHGPYCGTRWTIDIGPKPWWHSHTCLECHRHLSGHPECLRQPSEGPTVRGRRRRKFLTHL